MKLEFFAIALKNLKKRKLRSSLTMIGIVISIATIFVLVSLSLGLQGAIKEQFRLLGTDKFFIQPRGQLAGPGTGGAVELTEDDIDVIDKVIGVKEIVYFTAASAKIEYKDEVRFAGVGGLPLETINLYIESFSLKLEDGRALGKGDVGEVMIGSQYKNNNFVGSQVSVRDKILINGREFRVKGILQSVGNPADDRLIYMSEDDFRALFDIPRRIDFIIVQIDDGNIEEISERVERRLNSARDITEDTQDFSILTPDELLASFGTILNIITAFLTGIAAISLIVGGIGIANTMYTSVLERTKEIGVMKAVGATNSDITSLFLIESGLLGLTGGILGVLLGVGVGESIEYIAVNQLATTLLIVSTPTWLIVGCLAFAFMAGAVSGTLPAVQASHVRPTEALRYE